MIRGMHWSELGKIIHNSNSRMSGNLAIEVMLSEEFWMFDENFEEIKEILESV